MSTVSVTYKAPKDDNKVVEMGGSTFFDGQTVKFDSEKDFGLLSKLRTNQHFKVSDKEPPKLSAKPAPVAVTFTTVEDDDGTFSILQNGAPINHAPISKEEADAFNALSDEDKAEYVK
ncbi:hypothetical protein [Rhizobium tubonense]|uniref:Uncharacterized protein n=1 Tax=Rhizobium tubonense TaxID=484088 RepID=A0A2W4C8X8_9HYPH|nr:hypothetical protein [Rhizobium tubonense]PZM07585.1 hypothetical protein CPY51_31135 [Rhizobium tubonense]